MIGGKPVDDLWGRCSYRESVTDCVCLTGVKTRLGDTQPGSLDLEWFSPSSYPGSSSPPVMLSPFFSQRVVWSPWSDSGNFSKAQCCLVECVCLLLQWIVDDWTSVVRSPMEGYKNTRIKLVVRLRLIASRIYLLHRPSKNLVEQKNLDKQLLSSYVISDNNTMVTWKISIAIFSLRKTAAINCQLSARQSAWKFLLSSHTYILWSQL